MSAFVPRGVIEAATNALAVVSAGVILAANRPAEQLFGYADGELDGMPFRRLFRDAGEPEPPPGGPGFRTGLRKGGGAVVVEVDVRPLRGAFEGLSVASIADTAAWSIGEGAQQLMIAVVESADDAIITKSLDGTIRSWNAGAARLLGYSADEIIGRPVTTLLPPDRQDEEGLILERIRRGERVAHFETVRQRRDGSLLDVSLTISPIRDRDGNVIGASKIMRDITEQHRAQDELRRSNADLEQFAYLASHDLQEPLRMVTSYTTLLAQRYRAQLDERAEKYISYAVDGARQMQRLVADLLDYSRVGSQGREPVPVAAGDVVERVLRLLERSIRESDAQIDVKPLPIVLADDVQLTRVFQNLIGNAIKFRRPDARPSITIDAEQRGQRWTFAVRDNGIGIEAEYASRIFQMFQRLHPRGTYDGSGVGLAIVKRIVERHGGTIWFTSEPDSGTTFSFTFAAVPAAS